MKILPRIHLSIHLPSATRLGFGVHQVVVKGVLGTPLGNTDYVRLVIMKNWEIGILGHLGRSRHWRVHGTGIRYVVDPV